MNKSARLLAVLGAAALTIGGAFVATSASAGAEVLWAKVSSNGVLLAGSGVTSVNKFGGGRYNLTTTFDISKCALTGTINTTGGSDPGPGSSSILVGAVNENTLFVRTATPSSVGAKSVDDDRPFSLAIFCS